MARPKRHQSPAALYPSEAAKEELNSFPAWYKGAHTFIPHPNPRIDQSDQYSPAQHIPESPVLESLHGDSSHVENEPGDMESSSTIESTSKRDQVLNTSKDLKRGNLRREGNFMRTELKRPKDEARVRRLCHEKHQLRSENHQLRSENHQLRSEKDEVEAKLRELEQQHQIILVASKAKDEHILGLLQEIHTKLVSTAHTLQTKG
ncbi:hypothetical protein N7490_006626 [Penicillium lividum]|nr:hypothetical protein N7490_006626 [Penicillium lividum]